MVHTTCAVRECMSSSRINKELRFHQFPHSEERCKLWVQACSRPDLVERTFESLKYTYICSLHFERHMYGKKSLKKTATPTLLLPTTYSTHTQTDVNILDDTILGSRDKRLILKPKAAQDRYELAGSSSQIAENTDTTKYIDSNASTTLEQDPLSRVIEKCRFCGEFSKYCVAVSGNMPYLAHNKTTLVLNDTSVQLDFNDGSLPNTVCRDCDAKLQEIADFVKVVKAAQDTLINVAEERIKIAETRVKLEVARAGETEVDTETETVVIKTEYGLQHEERDDEKEDNEGIVDSLAVGETVFVEKSVTYKRKSDTVTANPKKLKTKKCDDEIMIDIKEEVIEKESQGLSEVSDYVKTSELELATNALVFENVEMAGEGTSKNQGYRSDK